MQLLQVDKLQKDYLENIGFSWHTDEDGSDYISDKLVCVSENEAMLIMRQSMSFMICL